MSLRALEFAARTAGDGATSRPNAEYKMHENRASEIRTDVCPAPATEVCCRRGTQVPLDLRSGKNRPQHRRIFLPDTEAPTNASLWRWCGPRVTRAGNRRHTDFAQSF